jgi:hypothetical protein
LKFTRFLFPPLFIFCSLSFVFFLAGNVRRFTDNTQYLLLRCVSVSGGTFFIYSLLTTCLFVFGGIVRRPPRHSGNSRHLPLAQIICGIIALAFAIIAEAVFRITKTA